MSQARGLRRFVERTAPPRSGSGDGHVVAAGKGGVGTSTVALLLAFAARQYGPVVLVDAGGGFGGPGALLGVTGAGDGDDVRRTDLGSDLALVHGPAGPAAESSARRATLRRMARAEGAATVIVDAGARPAAAIQALSDFGTSLIAVMGGDGVSPAAAYSLVKLAWHVRPETRVTAIANGVSDAGAALVHDAVRSAARRFADRAIDHYARFPEAPALAEPDPSTWATLDRTEPALIRAVAAAATRLFRPQTTTVNSTLQLLK